MKEGLGPPSSWASWPVIIASASSVRPSGEAEAKGVPSRTFYLLNHELNKPLFFVKAKAFATASKNGLTSQEKWRHRKLPGSAGWQPPPPVSPALLPTAAGPGARSSASAWE